MQVAGPGQVPERAFGKFSIKLLDKARPWSVENLLRPIALKLRSFQGVGFA